MSGHAWPIGATLNLAYSARATHDKSFMVTRQQAWQGQCGFYPEDRPAV
jgi:hypothetical protein